MATTANSGNAVYLSSRREATHQALRSRPNASSSGTITSGSSGRRKPVSFRPKAGTTNNNDDNSNRGRTFFLLPFCIAGAIILVLLVLGNTISQHGSSLSSSTSTTSLGRYATWEEAPASMEEFDHDNDKSVCRLPILSVEEWEAGRYWEREVPVIVQNVTDGWMALEHWTKKELLKRYPDVMVGMGRSKDLGQTGPDDAGDALTKTTIRVREGQHRIVN